MGLSPPALAGRKTDLHGSHGVIFIFKKFSYQIKLHAPSVPNLSSINSSLFNIYIGITVDKFCVMLVLFVPDVTKNHKYEFIYTVQRRQLKALLIFLF